MDGNLDGTREHLLRCALRLFADRGYDAVGVQQIVEAAGVTKPTMYHYFGSKRGLLRTLLAEHLEPLHHELRSAVAGLPDLPLALTAIARVMFAFAGGRPEIYRLYLSLWLAPARGEAYLAGLRLHEQHFRIVESAFPVAGGGRDGGKKRRRACAAVYLGTLNTYVGLALNEYLQPDEALVRQVVRDFLHGIEAG